MTASKTSIEFISSEKFKNRISLTVSKRQIDTVNIYCRRLKLKKVEFFRQIIDNLSSKEKIN